MRVGAWLSGIFKRSRLKRFGVIAVTLLMALLTMTGISIWRLRSLGDLPDVGDPFDVSVARRPIVVPDEDNAFVSFTAARPMMTTLTADIDRSMRKASTWSSAPQKVRDYLETNRPALEKWREGTERPEALYHQPGEITVDTFLPMAQHLGTFSRLASLEGSRWEEQGAMDKAWSWYKAMLRSSRHIGRHGVLVERQMGAYDHERAVTRINHWAADPRVNATQLRRALSDAITADLMTPPVSESMKLGYLIELRELDEQRETLGQIPLPGGPNGWLEKIALTAGVKKQAQQVRLAVTNDVERSRRVLRLLYANWLAQVDKAAQERAPIAIHKPNVIFAADPHAPPAARAIVPEELKTAIDHTLLAEYFHRPKSWSTDSWSEWYWQDKGMLAREPRRRAVLLVKLAAELYLREHGKPPANAGSLIGTSLQELPSGFKSSDAIPEGID